MQIMLVKEATASKNKQTSGEDPAFVWILEEADNGITLVGIGFPMLCACAPGVSISLRTIFHFPII